MTKFEAYIFLGGTILFTVIGQLLLKSQVLAAGLFPDGLIERLLFYLRIMVNPWVIAATLSTFVAGFCYIAALTRLPITVGYPFLSLTFPLVLIGGALFFGEPINWQKIAAIIFILAGLTIQSQV